MLNWFILIIALLALVSPLLVTLIQWIQKFVDNYRNNINSDSSSKKKMIENEGEEDNYDVDNDDDDVDNGTNNNNKNHVWAKRGSSRRKAIYKRNNQLSDYLDRQTGGGGSGGSGADNNSTTTTTTTSNATVTSFQQIGTPWRNYVQNSRYESRLQGLSNNEIKLFESIFEIILTEKSYLRQLEQLTHFAEHHPKLNELISGYHVKLLFGNAKQLYGENHRLYDEFEHAFQADIFMPQVFTILSKYLTNGTFNPYIDYIKFHEERNRLINDDTLCNAVPEIAKLRSLIIVPMQRITRYPLLVKASLDMLDKIITKEGKDNSIAARHLDRDTLATCYTNAAQFASKCNKALDDERKLYELIEFKKQLIGGSSIEDLVAPDREIVHKIPVKLYFLRSGGGGGGGGHVINGINNSLPQTSSTTMSTTTNATTTTTSTTTTITNTTSNPSIPRPPSPPPPSSSSLSSSLALPASISSPSLSPSSSMHSISGGGGGTSSGGGKVKATIVLLTDMIILTECKQKKNQCQYIVIDYDHINMIEFDRRRRSMNAAAIQANMNNAGNGGGGGGGGATSGSDESLNTLFELANTFTNTVHHHYHQLSTSSLTSSSNKFGQSMLTLKSNDNTYGITFGSSDDEERFTQTLLRLRKQSSSSSSSSTLQRSASDRYTTGDGGSGSGSSGGGSGGRKKIFQSPFGGGGSWKKHSK